MNSYTYESGFGFENIPIPHITCRTLGARNAFSTRLGGVSHGNGLDTLDLGAGNDEQVSENRRRFASFFGIEPCKMFSAKQIHSSKVETVTENDLGRKFECDGFVTDRKNLLLTVKSADCVPILLCDSQHGIIGAVHAGWRGTAAGIVCNAVAAMVSLGSEVSCIGAAIGPCIHPCCYEVDDPFVQSVSKTPLHDILLPHISPSLIDGKYFADLPSMNRSLLISCGVQPQKIYTSGFCTSCLPQFLFSHRASGGKRGLMMAGIIL